MSPRAGIADHVPCISGVVIQECKDTIPAMIKRPRVLQALKSALEDNPVAVLLGPRQCGKTTLARLLAEKTQATIFDLERAADRATRTPGAHRD